MSVRAAGQAAASELPGHFIPVRKSDIARALRDEARIAGTGSAEAWREFCRLLGAIFHYEYFAELERLKEAYYYFNPHHRGERPGDAAMRAAYADLVKALQHVLARANFIEVPRRELDTACRTQALVPVEVHTPLEDYRDIRFFRRGSHSEEVEFTTWFGFKKHKRTIEVYDDVVLVAAAKPPQELATKEQRKRVGRSRFRNGGVIIKYFRDIASADLNTLLPNVRVVMSIRDKWFLGLPALVGGVPLLLKLAPVLTVIAVLVGIRFGAAGEDHEDMFKQSIAVLSGLLALGGFVTHQWLKYQRQSLRYQLDITDNLYFRNLNNNAEMFDAVIGAAEDQECKEALLAYFFLLGEPMSQASLDARIEAWLRKRFSCDVDFEVDDGVAKLERFGLLTRTREILSVPPLSEALRRLDRHWDDLFRYNVPAQGGPSPNLS
jgi:hypothetical protein